MFHCPQPTLEAKRAVPAAKGKRNGAESVAIWASPWPLVGEAVCEYGSWTAAPGSVHTLCWQRLCREYR